MAKYPKGMVKKRGRYYLRERRGGREQWSALGDDWTKALDRYTQLVGRGVGVDRRVTLEQFSTRWLEEYVRTRRRSHRAELLAGQRLRDYVLPLLGRRRLADITTADLRTLRRELETKSISGRTVFHVLSDVRCLFNYAAEEAQVIDRSPFRGSLMPVLQKSVPDPFSAEELAIVLEATPPQFEALVRLALMTGLRFGELRALRWDDVVQREHPHLIVRRSHDGPTKSRKTRLVPLTIDADALMRGIARTSVYVFVGRSGGMMGRHPTSLERVIKRYLPKYRFHRFRHTFSSRYLEAGGSIETLRLILGHSTVMLTESYARIDDRHVWQEMRSLDLRLPETGDAAGDIAMASLSRGVGKS